MVISSIVISSTQCLCYKKCKSKCYCLPHWAYKGEELHIYLNFLNQINLSFSDYMELTNLLDFVVFHTYYV